MRLTRTLAGVAAAALLVGGASAAAAPAALAAPSGPIPATGVTSVTTAPGLAGALIRKGIVPYGLGPTSTKALFSFSKGLQVRYGFPVTGVTLDDAAAGAANPANVNILHSGGLAFANVFKGTRVTTRNYTIDISGGVITADVTANGSPVGRIPVYAISLANASVSYTVPTDGKADVRNVAVRLAPGVAGTLNSVLKTSVFGEGATIGTARVVVSSVG
jgi:hypothetical protein